MDGRRKAADSSDRSNIEDRSDAFPDHLLVEGLCDGEQAADIGIDDPVP